MSAASAALIDRRIFMKWEGSAGALALSSRSTVTYIGLVTHCVTRCYNLRNCAPLILRFRDREHMILSLPAYLRVLYQVVKHPNMRGISKFNSV